MMKIMGKEPKSGNRIGGVQAVPPVANPAVGASPMVRETEAGAESAKMGIGEKLGGVNSSGALGMAVRELREQQGAVGAYQLDKGSVG